MKWAILFFLITSVSVAGEFNLSKVKLEKIKCSYNNGRITFADIKTNYQPYEKKMENVKSLACEKIQTQGLQFYTLQFNSVINVATGAKKIFVFEVALLDKKTNALQTVRSEIIDQIDLSGDVADTEFTRSFRFHWGQSQKDKKIMLQLELSEKNEKSFSYALKLNSKKTWFENVF